MAEQEQGDRRGAKFSALLLVLTGIALAGCVALAVGVTVRLVDVPRPRITANLSLETGAPVGGDPAGDLSLVGNPVASASERAAAEAAKLAAKRAAKQQASRSRVRHHTPPTDAPDVTPSPTPPAVPDGGQPDPDLPDNPRFQPRWGDHLHP